MGKKYDKSPEFWRTTPLEQMTPAQWESLCDQCGRCCLIKLEDADAPAHAPERYLYTRAACRLMDCGTGRCSAYANRLHHVPDCLVLTPESLKSQKDWMPETCAYRRLTEGRALPDWHPLVTGQADSTAEAGMSIAGWCFSESEVAEEELGAYLIDPFHLQG